MACTTVSYAAGYLKRSTRYSSALGGVDTATIHRGYLEDLLRREYYDDYFRLGRYEKLVNEDLFNFITMKTEMDEILMCILHINSGTDDHISTMPSYMNRYTCFDLNELPKADTFPKLLAVLRKTPYYKLLEGFAPEKGQQINYRKCELVLRTDYYNRLLKSSDELSDDSLSNYLCSQIDIINIINAFRLNKNFHASKEDIIAAMIPIYRRLPKKKFEELYGAEDEKEYQTLLAKTIYGREVAKLGIDFISTEESLHYVRYLHTKRSFAMSQLPELTFFTYNRLMEIEMKNIIRIIEGIRYNVPVQEISKLVICD